MYKQTSTNIRSNHRQIYYSIKLRYNKLKEITEIYGHNFKIVIWPISIKPITKGPCFKDILVF